MKSACGLAIALTMLVQPSVASAQAIVVDHTSLSLFDRIPDQYLTAARNLRFLFMDRSVGVNTNDSLSCLTASSYGSLPAPCRQDYQFANGSWQLLLRDDASLAAGLVGPYIRVAPSPTKYDRSRWDYRMFYGAWEEMTPDFVTGLHNGSIPAMLYPSSQSVNVNPMDYDVISFQFSYLNVTNGSTIMNFFTNRPGTYDDAYDLEREIGEHLTNSSPRKFFVYFTSSLARSVGTQVSMDFNQRMREWCRTTNCILFDFADIEAYDSQGRPCYDDRDGVAYAQPNTNLSENNPDDGLNIPAICQEKTIEVTNGHLSTAQGYIPVAKAMWVLLARIAGWSPDGTTSEAPPPPQNLRLSPSQ